MPAEPESNISNLFRTQHGDAYNRFNDRDRASHAELLGQIVKHGDLQLDAQRKNDLQWVITVSTADSVGLLSVIAGLFAAHRIDITSGDLFTIHIKSAAETRRSNPFKHRRNSLHHQRSRTVYRKILDVFEVRTEQGVNEIFWKAFSDELTSLLALVAEGKIEQVRENIIFRVTAVFRENENFDERLLPISIFMDNESSPSLTGLRIQTLDTPGFIFEFSNALAMLNVNIERVEIRSVNNEVQDYFWVSDSRRRKIEESDRLNELRLAATLIKQLTHLLPRAPNPAQALSQFSALTLQMLSNPDWIQEVQALQSNVILRTIAELMGVSQFLWEDFLRMQHENLFPVISDVSGLDRNKTKADLLKEIEECVAIIEEENERINQLNKFKDREMFRIDLRHITQRIEIMAFSDALSDLAEVIVTYACEHAHSTLENNLDVHLVLMAMYVPGLFVLWVNSVDVNWVSLQTLNLSLSMREGERQMEIRALKTLIILKNGSVYFYGR
jgi:glutamate-ammonia-ligase adenylyltransferase